MRLRQKAVTSIAVAASADERPVYPRSPAPFPEPAVPPEVPGRWLAYRAAISRAVAESGPGCGTNTVSR